MIDGLVNLAARIVWILSYPVRMLQSGRVSNYALLIVLGVLLFLGYYLHVAGVTLHSVLHYRRRGAGMEFYKVIS